MSVPHVEFGPAIHGWLSVRLNFGAEPIWFSASDIEQNSLPNLIVALLALAEDRPASVDWWLEPAVVEFAFAMQDAQAELTVYQWDDDPPDGRAREGCELLGRWTGSRENLLAEFRRALVALEPTLPVDRHWELPFPSELLRRLEKAI